MTWDRDRWYTIRVEWDQGDVKLYRDGKLEADRSHRMWRLGSGIGSNYGPMPWPYAPAVHRLWLGSSGPRTPSRILECTYRNLRVVSYD